MPPGYKPLQTGALPAGLIAQSFNDPGVDWNDAEKAQALLRATEIANQINDINAQKSQQNFDMQNQIREQIKNQFGQQEDGTTPPFDESAVLGAIQRSAMGQGDFNTALDAEKIKHSNTGNRPLSPDEVQSLRDQGLDIPDGATLADARLYQSLNNSGIAKEKIHGVQSRFDTGMDYKHLKDQAPGIFDNLTNADGGLLPIDSTQKKALSGIETGLDQILRNADGLADAIDSNKITYGDTLKAQKQMIANILPALRQLDNQGVRFNEFLKDIDIHQLGDDAGLVDRITGLFTGQDPATAVRRFAQEVAKQSQIRAHANNGVFSPEKADAFDPTGETSALYSKYGLFGRGQNPAQQEPDVSGALQRGGGGLPLLANYGGVPRNPDGSVLSREQFMKLHGG